MKSCMNCGHSEVCKFYHGELERRNYIGKDFQKEIAALQRTLASKCPDYILRERK